MAHLHSVKDTDTYFLIDPVTRAISNEKSKKTTLMQFDHNSERFTFELPRYIEEHDMSQSNLVEVHFINIDAVTRAQNTGVYTVDDIQIAPDDSEKVICSWLVSSNATRLAGTLTFIVRFCCVTDTKIDYAWNTDRFTVAIANGINASELFEAEYVDIIEQWKESVMQTFRDDLTAWKAETATAMKAEVKAEFSKEIAVERARIDNLASSTTVDDAELIDIRVDVNGNAHATAGKAVREQIKALDNVLRHKDVEITSDDFEQGSWAVEQGGFYKNNSRVRCVLSIGKGDIIYVNPNGQHVNFVILENRSSLTAIYRATYSYAEFEWACPYDGFIVFLACLNPTENVAMNPKELTAIIKVHRGVTNTVSRDRIVYPVQYELGNISMQPTAFYYWNSNSRVRTPEGYTVPLCKGDIIKLTDYENARFYVGWILPDGTYNFKGWLTDDFICIEDAEYVILVCNLTDTEQDNAVNLGSRIEVQTSISNLSIQQSIAENQWQTKEIHRLSKSNRNIRSVNHRGYNTLAPENTLSAYRISKRMGFEYVECDVSFTSDSVAVLLHDSTIDRTSNGTGNIANMTYETVKSLDFGSWFSDTFTGEKIPSFAEFIELCKRSGLHPYIEVKTGTEAQVNELVSIVKKYGMQDNVSWISFGEAYLNYIKQAYSRARLGYVVSAVDESVIATAQELKNSDNEVFIDSAYYSLTDASVQLCINANIPLEVWTIDNKEAIMALHPYVSGFTSDKIIANEVFYDESAIDEKAIVIRGGDPVVIGKTPKKGVDYYTESEKNEIVEEVMSQISESVILKSSTNGSTKKFRITIDDSGTLSTVEILT